MLRSGRLQWLTCPALVCRYARPCLRYMPATSNFVRGKARVLPRSLPAVLLVQLFACCEQAGCIPVHLGGDFSILGGGRQLGMPRQNMNDPHIGPRFQQKCRKAVPQRVHGCRLVDPCHGLGRCEGPVELAWRHRIDLWFAGNSRPSGRALHR